MQRGCIYSHFAFSSFLSFLTIYPFISHPTLFCQPTPSILPHLSQSTSFSVKLPSFPPSSRSFCQPTPISFPISLYLSIYSHFLSPHLFSINLFCPCSSPHLPPPSLEFTHTHLCCLPTYPPPILDTPLLQATPYPWYSLAHTPQTQTRHLFPPLPPWHFTIPLHSTTQILPIHSYPPNRLAVGFWLGRGMEVAEAEIISSPGPPYCTATEYSPSLKLLSCLC